MDIEKTLEQITVRLDQLAQHQVRQQETLGQTITGFAELREYQQRMAQMQLELVQRQTQQQQTVELLVTAVRHLREHAEHADRRFEEMRKEMQAGFRELREAQQHTDGNLNALIKVLDDLIRRNGRK